MRILSCPFAARLWRPPKKRLACSVVPPSRPFAQHWHHWQRPEEAPQMLHITTVLQSLAHTGQLLWTEVEQWQLEHAGKMVPEGARVLLPAADLGTPEESSNQHSRGHRQDLGCISHFISHKGTSFSFLESKFNRERGGGVRGGPRLLETLSCNSREAGAACGWRSMRRSPHGLTASRVARPGSHQGGDKREAEAWHHLHGSETDDFRRAASHPQPSPLHCQPPGSCPRTQAILWEPLGRAATGLQGLLLIF